MSSWQLELPAGLDDVRYRGFLAVLRRLDALPTERVLVWRVESTSSDVLPHLAEFFGVVGVDWASGPPRPLLQRGVDLVRRMGTVGALRAALAAAGYPDVEIQQRLRLRYDGTARYDGRWRYGSDTHWARFVVVIDAPSEAEVMSPARVREVLDMIREWGRPRSPFSLVLTVAGAVHSQYRRDV